jgi:hypothetical protein
LSSSDQSKENNKRFEFLSSRPFIPRQVIPPSSGDDEAAEGQFDEETKKKILFACLFALCIGNMMI